jgi:hypothetical protein
LVKLSCNGYTFFALKPTVQNDKLHRTFVVMVEALAKLNKALTPVCMKVPNPSPPRRRGSRDLKESGFPPKLVPAGFRRGACGNDDPRLSCFVVTLKVMVVRRNDVEGLS